MRNAMDYTLVPVLCWRELRHGLRGFGVFLGCLVLGVFAITGVGTFSESARQGLLQDARSIMGGDMEIMLTSRAMGPKQEAFFSGQGDLSRVAETRTMARADGRSILVEAKGVDRAYPLYGSLRTVSGVDARQILAGSADLPGAVVDPLLLDRLHLGVGGVITIGTQSYRVGGVLAFEPDRVVQAFALGPRVLLGFDGLVKSGLTGPGSLIRYRYRVKLTDKDPLAVIQAAQKRFPDAGWAMRDFSRAAPNIQRLLERLDINLTLMGLAALLVGGLGISGAVRGYLEPRLERIAVMKCLGGTGPVLLGTYLLQILLLGGLGSLAGMMLGGLVPSAATYFWGERLPVHVRTGIYVGPMLRAGLFGICTTLAFSTGPLVRAIQISPAALFRGYVNGGGRGGGLLARFLPVCFFILLILLVFAFAGNMKLASGFVFGTAGCFVLFRLAAGVLKTVARHAPFIAYPSVRLGLGQIVRPGAPTTSLVFALGLGLTCLVAVALVNVNLTRALTRDIALQTPSFFFMDVMPRDVGRFAAMVENIAGPGSLDRSPVIRGRIMKIGGANVSGANVAPEVDWAVRGDRMLTYAAAMPKDTILARGTWWPVDYHGPARISLTSDLARGFGVDIGDTLTINVLGRNITATIANIRDVDWTTLAMQFAIIFAPGVLDTAPQTTLATVRADAKDEARIFERVSETFPSVAIIRVKEVLDTVGVLFANMAAVFQGVSGIALLSGFLVLGGAFSADQHRRIYDAVIYKVCGATRWDILLALITEFAVIGIGTGIISCITGALAAWGVIEGFMHMRFTLDPSLAVITVLAGTGLALFFGLAGTVRALGKKPARYLRNE